ncbi:hypothetical protein G3I60_29135 [Streptomyces sp. SID13666]|uniref:hypothetical protein n=1 Tax=Streptomyces TaxID=1883 RepID=UPI0011059D39|nr:MULTISPECIES: hypothetical protein [Streptomyces]MCZ4100284.1 hypothetical protein [Streptomyces sp. H39-C1]NEA58113.1 hypothetical protein [Streptomyces sp. SID13666]NEA74117.1 hypothetical protein [Streptomyces sp. SID13588]QNA73456.1 hypothetical protein C8250_017390 [Streptomyces sp. So13.3]
MNHNAPHTPRPLDHLSRTQQRILTTRQLREHGVTASTLAERCRPGGPWQQLLPQVFLLHAGPPTSDERLRAALLYAGCEPGGTGGPGDGEAMVTGLAALALHRFSSVPPLLGIDRIDVLVPRQRRLRDAGDVAIHRAHTLPRPQQVTGLPCAPVPRALADAVADLDDAETVRRLLTEAVRGGHCEAAAVVRELSRARLLSRPHVVDAVDALLAEGRALAEGRLYEMVTCYGLPDPVWHVDLRLPGGPSLGGVDAYWPEHAVALEIDARGPRQDDDALWSQYAQKREHLEGLGITVVHLTPKKLRDALEQQATVVRTALMASSDRTPAAYVVVTPS